MSAALAYPVLILFLLAIQCAAYWKTPGAPTDERSGSLNGDDQP